MLILIEGSEGLGKTTLAKALQWKLRTAYVHHCPPDNWQLESFKTVLPNAVYDRFHWSMWAYKNARRQPLDLDILMCVAIDDWLKTSLNGQYKTVLLFASDPNYFDSKPEDHLFGVDVIKDVNERYKQIAPLYFDMVIDVAATGYPSAEQVLDQLGL